MLTWKKICNEGNVVERMLWYCKSETFIVTMSNLKLEYVKTNMRGYKSCGNQRRQNTRHKGKIITFTGAAELMLLQECCDHKIGLLFCIKLIACMGEKAV